ncbi:MAG: GvpL/GvpF family gas vesicle protein [Anaerolineae bacterium]|nr:GvpL/GvpF family gas vesicle protein [Anaerolineae bacterium]
MTREGPYINAAFLVERAREEKFDRAVEEVDHEMGKRVTFRYFGPLPPYDFTNILVLSLSK